MGAYIDTCIKLHIFLLYILLGNESMCQYVCIVCIEIELEELASLPDPDFHFFPFLLAHPPPPPHSIFTKMFAREEKEGFIFIFS